MNLKSFSTRQGRDEERRRLTYLYSGTDVLINILKIRDQAQLDEAEAVMLIQMEPSRPRLRHFTLSELCAVHKHLFGNIYEWAGTTRDYTTQRGESTFSEPQNIASQFDGLHKDLHSENYLCSTSPESFADRAARYANRLNAIHPFIDGNGRCTRIFLNDLTCNAGHSFDQRRINKLQWQDAMIKAFNGDEGALNLVAADRPKAALWVPCALRAAAAAELKR